MKKALLAVSFGTTVPGAERSIENIENALKARCPDRTFLRAFTSRIICRKLSERGRPVPGPEEAFEKLLGDGVEDVVVMSTHFTPGDEYDKLCRIAENYREKFKAFAVGKPLISGPEDLLRAASCVREHFADLRTDLYTGETALLLMGHGSRHIASMIYGALQTAFGLMGEENILVGTVEGWPALGDCAALLKNKKVRTVHLSPFMLVAGDHALNDMAGDGEDSWKSVLTAEGFEVICHTEGMGSWENIGKMYEAHLEEALG